jgi:phage terminase large subunit
MAQVKLIHWQLEVTNDPHRFKIICAGRRAGKSVLSRLVVLKWAVEQQGLYWIVSPSYKMSKMIHWQALQKEVPRSWIVKKNEVELSITLKNGSIIELKGAENPDALRGVKLRGLIIDEIASIRNWSWLWEEVLRPTLTDYQSPALFISTPKGFNHFYDLYVSGQGSQVDYKSWKFTSYDNPHIAKEELDAAKKELTEDTFAQEYMADFRKYTGLVFKEFDRDIHVVEPFDIPNTWPLYRAIDFGSTNPTACLWITVDDDDNFFVFSEHYQTGQTIDYHAGIINSRIKRPVVATFGDPSGAQWISEFATKGIYITPANKESNQTSEGWVRFGIEKVAERLRVIPGHFVSAIRRGHAEPRLFIFNICPNTISEFENYRWQEKSVSQAQDLNEPDKPEKANDHAMDALRYFVVSYRKQVNPVIATNNFKAYSLD